MFIFRDMWRSVSIRSPLPVHYQTKRFAQKLPTTFYHQKFTRNFHLGLQFSQDSSLGTQVQTNDEIVTPNVGESNDTKSFYRRAHDMLTAYNYEGILSLEKEMNLLYVTPTPNLLSLFLESSYKLMKNQQKDTIDTLKYYSLHDKYNLQKNFDTYLYYMLSCQFLKKNNLVKETYYELKKNNINPTRKIIHIALRSALSMSDYEWGKEIEQDILTYEIEKSDLSNQYINRLILKSTKSRNELKEVFEFLKVQNEQIDPALYSTILEVSIKFDYVNGITYIWEKLYQDSTNVLDEGTSLRILEVLARVPSSTTYSIATAIYQRLQQQGIDSPSASIAMFSIYIDNNQFSDAVDILCKLPPNLHMAVSAVIARRFLVIPQVNNMSVVRWKYAEVTDLNLLQVEKALDLVEQKWKEGQKISSFIFHVLIRACGLAGNLEISHKVFMKIEPIVGSVDVDSYNYLLEACSLARHGSYALQVMQDMKSRDIKPNSYTYHFLIITFTYPGDDKAKAIEIMDMALASNCNLYLKTFNRCINFMIYRGDLDTAQHYCNLMKGYGYDTVTTEKKIADKQKEKK